ncbi:MAG: Tad domain-containing protein [Kordiimonadaceae bacterium]|nr:Tad domain-containing protein [Kordiimonadaceae bacterium]
MPVVAGFAGLAFDATGWYMEKRMLQNVTDSSALAAAYSISKGNEATEVELAAYADAQTNSFTVGGSNTMLVESPPSSGDYAGQANFVMVTSTTPASGTFTRILGRADGTIKTIATAGILAVGEHCILALDHKINKALEFSGTSDVDINCGVASNSSSSESIYLNGKATLTANPSAQAYGDIYTGGSATLNVPNPIQPFSQRSPDPYENITVPSDPATCTDTNLKLLKATDPAPTPGRYCGGIDFGSQSNVSLDPGVYIMDGGELRINAGATISGDGVTIILTGDSPENVATMKVNGGANVTLSAPTSGDYKGVTIYQDRNADPTGNNDILGGASMIINGAVYFPSQEITYSGGSKAVSTCLQIIGKKVTFNGNAELYNDQSTCDLYGVTKISRTLVTLVE